MAVWERGAIDGGDQVLVVGYVSFLVRSHCVPFILSLEECIAALCFPVKERLAKLLDDDDADRLSPSDESLSECWLSVPLSSLVAELDLEDLGDMVDIAREASVAYEDVRNDATPTNWLLLEYVDAKTDSLILAGTGSGGLQEFVSHLKEDQAAFGFLRMVVGNDELSLRAKFVLITWCGSGVKVMRKAKLSVHIADVKRVLQSFAVEVNASSKDDLKEDEIKALLKKAMGANYDSQASAK
ncbi:hypothetical protein HDU96_002360 [Phlyctochytrium bullatum]|nr:hypothetical protein HDU96_002360 [Phlyctochytrium bullatum]